MVISAEVKCYYCGYVSGYVEGEADAPLTPSAFRPNTIDRVAPYQLGERLRCRRCGGPVYLEDVTVLRRRRCAA